MTPLNEKQYIEALEKLKRSPRDRIGILGEMGATGLGAVAGAAASGAVAGAAGAATLAGSSTLASIFGGVLVTATPIGWVVGTAVAGAGIGYAIGKMVRSGGKADVYKANSIQDLEDRIRAVRLEVMASASFEEKFRGFITGIQHLIANNRIRQSKATELIVGVQQHRVSIDDALQVVEMAVNESK